MIGYFIYTLKNNIVMKIKKYGAFNEGMESNLMIEDIERYWGKSTGEDRGGDCFEYQEYEGGPRNVLYFYQGDDENIEIFVNDIERFYGFIKDGKDLKKMMDKLNITPYKY
jgi:hypothetical protein